MIGCHVVKQLVDSVVGCFGGSRWLLAEFSEINEELVVNFLCAVKHSSNNGLDTEDSYNVQVGAVVRACNVLDFGAVRDGSMLV